MCEDYEMTPSEYLGTQHRLLVMDMEISSSKRKKRTIGDPRVRWWNLIKGNATKLYEKLRQKGVGNKLRMQTKCGKH